MTSGLLIVKPLLGDVIANVICGVTVTVTESVVVPPGPVAVTVYVVVSIGETVVVRLSATLPIPGSISQESALVEVHVKVDDSPARMGCGTP
jgi:hypothetical protein